MRVAAGSVAGAGAWSVQRPGDPRAKIADARACWRHARRGRYVWQESRACSA